VFRSLWKVFPTKIEETSARARKQPINAFYSNPIRIGERKLTVRWNSRIDPPSLFM